MMNTNNKEAHMVKMHFIPLVIVMLVTGMILGGCAQQATPTPPLTSPPTVTPAPAPTVTPAPAPTVTPAPAAPELAVVRGIQGIDLSSYGKIELDVSRIEVSSTNSPVEGKENLIKGLGDPYWHVKHPRETDETWIVVDLGSETRLDVFAIRPRSEHPQLWDGDAAILEGSNDNEEWDPQVKLELYLGELDDQDWIAFILPENMGSYRYYRLFSTYPNFLSLGGLELYGEGGIPVVKP